MSVDLAIALQVSFISARNSCHLICSNVKTNRQCLNLLEASFYPVESDHKSKLNVTWSMVLNFTGSLKAWGYESESNRAK